MHHPTTATYQATYTPTNVINIASQALAALTATAAHITVIAAQIGTVAERAMQSEVQSAGTHLTSLAITPTANQPIDDGQLPILALRPGPGAMTDFQVDQPDSGDVPPQLRLAMERVMARGCGDVGAPVAAFQSSI